MTRGVGTQTFFDNLSENYDDYLSSMDSYGAIVQTIREKTSVQEKDTVLDIGIGTGRIAIALARLCGKDGKVIGIDISSRMLQVARQNIEEAGLSDMFELYEGNAEDFSLKEDLADIVVCASVFRYFQDQKEMLSKIHRVLKSGGRLVLLDISLPENPESFRYKVSKIIWGNTIRTPDEMRSFIEECKLFRNVETEKKTLSVPPGTREKIIAKISEGSGGEIGQRIQEAFAKHIAEGNELEPPPTEFDFHVTTAIK
ncbi:MAG: methyltransferase domain-containing protein [bacterium]